MTNLERREGESHVLFPLDSDVIRRLHAQTVTGIRDPEFGEEPLEEGHEQRSANLFRYLKSVAGLLGPGDYYHIFMMSALFAYGAIGITAKKRKIDLPTVIAADILTANEIFEQIAPTVPLTSGSLVMPVSLEGALHTAKLYSDILENKEEALSKSVSALVGDLSSGIPKEDRMTRIIVSIAHFGAGTVYFPMAAARKRLIGEK